MRTQNVSYWINQLQGKNKAQPKNKEEQAAYQIAEYLICRQKEKDAA